MEIFEFFNPHPQQKLVGDCVKRAIVKATGMPYKEVQRELNRIKREIGADAFNSDRVWRKFLIDRNFVKISYPAVAGQKRMTVRKLAETSNKSDVYVCQCAKHLVCVTNGHYYDTWDCGEKCVYLAYKLQR